MCLERRLGGGQIEVFVLVVSDVLDHDAQAGCMMTNTVLATLKQHRLVDWAAISHLLLVCDCGPHFRSKENFAHFLITVPSTLQMSVELCYLAEQHGKSGVDRCFGWCNGWIEQYILRYPIYNLADLITCFKVRHYVTVVVPFKKKQIMQAFIRGSTRLLVTR